jgi:hypothetical protein
MESNQSEGKLRTQIDYYLSDENLKTDKFFHEKISEDKDVFIFN